MPANLNIVLKPRARTVSRRQLFIIVWMASSYNELLTSISSGWLLYKKTFLPIRYLNKTYKDLPYYIRDYKK